MAAVIHRAALDYANAMATRDIMLSRRLREWFLCDAPDSSELSDLFCFPWICECLDIDHAQFRNKLFSEWRGVAWTDTARADRTISKKSLDDDDLLPEEAGLPEGVQRAARRDQTACAT